MSDWRKKDSKVLKRNRKQRKKLVGLSWEMGVQMGMQGYRWRWTLGHVLGLTNGCGSRDRRTVSWHFP